MAGEWCETTLGDVLMLQRGFDLPETLRKPGPYPVIASTGPVGTHIEAPVQGPGVVIGRSGSLGGGQYIQGDFWPLNTTLWVKDFKGNDRRFCYYLLKSLDLASFNAGSGVPTLNRNHIHPLPLSVPVDPQEQRAIAHILGTLDDKIELNRRMNETLEAMARALFKSWFVDFDPVRGKADGRDLGLPKHIADLFPDSFEDSELGEIPDGWEINSIGDLADVAGGTTPSTKEPAYWEGGTHAWATPKDLSGLTVPVIFNTERRITDAGLSQIGSGLLPKGTVLLSSRAPIGYLAVAEIPVAINQGFIAMTPKTGTSNIFLLLWASVAHEEIVSRANGSTFLEISKANFRPIPVVTPSADVMRVFEELARPLYERIVESARESRTLVALRDSLLPKLISGELRVSGLKKTIPGDGQREVDCDARMQT
jgi:type I restriction enzyme, S subunit